MVESRELTNVKSERRQPRIVRTEGTGMNFPFEYFAQRSRRSSFAYVSSKSGKNLKQRDETSDKTSRAHDSAKCEAFGRP